VKRSYVKVGDLTTSGARVVEGIERMTHHGTMLSFLGARIYCPACKSEGHIVATGPRWPDNLMGKHAALDGDLGLCRCEPAPRLIASQGDMFQACEVHERVALGFEPGGSPPAATEPDARAVAAFDDRFVLCNDAGKPLARIGYAVRRQAGDFEYGETDSQGHTHLLASDANAERVELFIAG